jgi:hypothetical protein
MTKSKKTPEIVVIGLWILSLIVFAVDFQHTHLGLKEMKPFGSDLGNLQTTELNNWRCKVL